MSLTAFSLWTLKTILKHSSAKIFKIQIKIIVMFGRMAVEVLSLYIPASATSCSCELSVHLSDHDFM